MQQRRVQQRSVQQRRVQQRSPIDVRAWPQRAVASIPAAVALVVWTPGLNDIEPAKLLLVALAAGVCLAAWLWRLVHDRQLLAPTGPFPLVLALAVAGLAISAVLSGHALMGLYGTRGRLDGVLLYLLSAVCALTAARVLARDADGVSAYLRALAWGGGLVAIIALLQVNGSTPLGLTSDLSGAISTLGNPNFLAGWAGAVSGAPLALLLWERQAARRVQWGVLLLVVLGGAAVSGSQQWVGSAVASCATATAVWVTVRTSGRRRALLLAGLAGLGALSLVVLAAGLAGTGPLRQAGTDIGTRLRGHYWQAAWTMFTDNPVAGVGPGRFVWEFRQARSPEAAGLVSLESVADSAHNVWLNFLAVGGILTVLPFLALVVFSGWAVRRRLQTLPATSPEFVGVAGLAAVEAGYLIQSLVSIEVPSLLVLHLMTAGVLAGSAGTIRWRAHPVAVPGSDRLRMAMALTAAVVLLVAVGLIGSRPLSAEVVAQQAFSGPGSETVPVLRSATDRAPWEPFYHELLGRELVQDDAVNDALVVLSTADHLADPNGTVRISAARAAAEDGRQDQAATLYDAALQAEPHHPELGLEYSRFQAEAGRTDRALTALNQLLASFPDDTGALALRGELQKQVGG